MKRFWILISIIVFFWIIQIAYSESTQPQPGSPDDPLITKGYVDQQVTEQIRVKTDVIRTELNQMIATNVTQSVQSELAKQTNELLKQFVDQQVAKEVNKEVSVQIEQYVPIKVNDAIQAKATYQLITIPPGQSITFKEGTEVIVRSGQLLVTSTDRNGISDLSDGIDVKPGAVVLKNHLLLFPRTGRGLIVSSTQKTNAALLVKGDYTLSQALVSQVSPQPTAIVQATPPTTPLTTGFLQ